MQTVSQNFSKTCGDCNNKKSTKRHSCDSCWIKTRQTEKYEDRKDIKIKNTFMENPDMCYWCFDTQSTTDLKSGDVDFPASVCVSCSYDPNCRKQNPSLKKNTNVSVKVR